MKLSVLMITYNQEKYIAQALDSVLMQEVDFDYEIVIGEDCSTDGTRGIVVEYQRRHPDKIRALLPEKNLGMIPNFVQTYYACEGEYVAILEGDDYWTCSTKLQKQVNFLDNHPESAICFHTAKYFYEDGSKPSYFFPAEHKPVSTIVDLLECNFMQTATVVFRNKLFGKFPDWFSRCVMGDYPLHILNAAHGSIGYINEVMSSYRIHTAGVWSMQMEKNFVRNMEGWIHLYKNLDVYFQYKYHSILKRKAYEHKLGIVKWYKSHKKYRLALKEAVEIIFNYPCYMFVRKISYELGKLK